MQIFLSYGHDRFEPLAEKIKRDLEADGHKVWFDRSNLRGSAEWEIEIENGIMGSDWLVLVMTDHSVRRPDGVCLDEVSKARFENKHILPLMVQQVVPPFCITRVQWVDMMTSYFNGEGKLNRKVYDERIREIRDIINGAKELGYEGEQAALMNLLRPMDNDVYYSNFRRDFYGRAWLLDIYRKWVSDRDSPKVFMILGKAGTGKTAFVASLCSREPEVVGIHFCRYNDSDRSDPKKALMSLAYHMSTQIPEYGDSLRSADLTGLREKSLRSVFQALFTAPLSKIERNDCCVLIIDALDEAQRESRNGLLDIVSSEFENTPSWLKVLLTSRPETDIKAAMAKYHPLVVEDQKQNSEDIRGYAAKSLENVNLVNREKVLDTITAKSQGNFLYASQTVRAILAGELDPEDFDGYPSGLDGIFRSNFNRFFESEMDFFKRDVRPFLEVLVSEFEPLPAEKVFDLVGTDEYDREDIVGRISSLFPMKEGIISPMHKSVYDWLIDKEKAYPYWVSPKKGHERLANLADTVLSKGSPDGYTVRYCVKHNLNCGRPQRAAELLSDAGIQAKRFTLLGVDSTAYEYFRELEALNRSDSSLASDVLRSEAFFWIMDTLQDHIMHMGAFPIMRDCGFDKVTDGILAGENWRRKQIVGLYYYTTGRTDEAMEIFKDISNNLPPGNDDILSGVNDMLGLSYKRCLQFDEAVKCLEVSVKIAPNRRVGASSMVNLSKIYYHELDWENAYKWATSGIEELQGYIDRQTDEDEKDSAIRFKAEFYRIKAEVAMWNMDAGTCDECYEESDKIHRMYDMKDQYQPRYHYTRLFVSMIKGETIPGERFDKVLGMEGNGYDKERTNFYRGMYLYALGDTDGAITILDECLRACMEADYKLERIEAEAMLELCGSEPYGIKNDFMTVWAGHVKSFAGRLRELYTSKN